MAFILTKQREQDKEQKMTTPKFSSAKGRIKISDDSDAPYR